MELKKVEKIDDLKVGDTIVITGDILNKKAIELKGWSIHKSGKNLETTEIIINKKYNRFFNLNMFLEGKSWVKELYVIK